MEQFAGRIAVVTGGGTGIGRELVRQLSAEGAHVSMCDVSEANMAESKALAEKEAPAGTRVTTFVADVADEAQVLAFRDHVLAEHGTDHVDLVFNNAGIGGGGSFVAGDRGEWERTFGVCWGGVYNGCRAFVPLLVASDEAHLVNVSSVFGLMGIPSQSAYNAAKFAVRGFTEALRIELDADGGEVSCTTIHPGGIKTNIARNGRFDDATIADLGQDPDRLIELSERAFRTTPEKAAQVILDAVQANKRRAFIGADAQLFKIMAMLPPGVYQNAIRLGTRIGARFAR